MEILLQGARGQLHHRPVGLQLPASTQLPGPERQLDHDAVVVDALARVGRAADAAAARQLAQLGGGRHVHEARRAAVPGPELQLAHGVPDHRIVSLDACGAVSGVTFASTLRKVYLADNPLSTIEICRSDVSVFQSLTEFTVPSSLASTCSNSKATHEEIQGVSFCVLEDEECVISSTSESESNSLAQADINDISSSSGAASSQESNTSSNSSIFSAESIGVIGSTFFLVGILLSALVFGFIWNKRRNSSDGSNDHSRRAAMKINRDRRLGSSGGNFMVFTSSGRVSRGNGNEEYRDTDSKNDNHSTFGSGFHTPGETAWGVYESPLDKYNPVAILEPSPNDNGYLGASTASLQVRSKLKSKINLDDLLVYEIPPEEIQMRRALHMSASKMSSKAALALSSVGVGNPRKKMDRALFLAEYQGYKVVIQALMRSKKRLEKRFVEQIRLAATFDHASIVHFIGVTTGCSTTASRRRGSSAVASPHPYNGNGPTNSTSESMARATTKSRYPNMGAPSWHLGVVFEFMQHGSLATMFESERHRREGKGFHPNASVAASIGSGNGNIFSWYPVFANSSASVNANPNADWRCKLSIALDVAMGLVYLHANNCAHGRVCARKVLVNEQGEAKLSAMDVLLPSDLTPKKDDNNNNNRITDDFRGSLRESAMWTMQKITGLRATRSSKAKRHGSGGNLGRRSRNANNSGQSDRHRVGHGGGSAGRRVRVRHVPVGAGHDDRRGGGPGQLEGRRRRRPTPAPVLSGLPAGAAGAGSSVLARGAKQAPGRHRRSGGAGARAGRPVDHHRPGSAHLGEAELPELQQRAQQPVELGAVVQYVVAAELVLRHGRVRGRSVREYEAASRHQLMYLFELRIRRSTILSASPKCVFVCEPDHRDSGRRVPSITIAMRASTASTRPRSEGSASMQVPVEVMSTVALFVATSTREGAAQRLRQGFA
ncbi:hypothetical protein ON010_g11565 [Phytophthora cinnamomi]|nr:hypothetical protein ON010_g11565 [Phytophthora cinnamomi]